MPSCAIRTSSGPSLLIAAVCIAAPGASLAQGAASAPPAPRAAPRVSEADIAFMQGMIGHHAQAVVMAHLVPSRTTSRAVRLIAERIDVAQQQEITQMRRWLEAHRGTVPAIDTGSAARRDHTATHGTGGKGKPMGDGPLMADGAMTMPGMLTPAQLDTLTAAKGTAFDRHFLRYMIQHHEGALVMVAKLFATRGSGQEPALFQFATDVDAGQRAEITRMHGQLKVAARSPHDARH